MEYNDGADISAATSLATSSDIVILCVAVTSSEGSDRDSLSLGDHQNSLIAAVSTAVKDVILVVNTPGAILFPVLDEALGALLISWLPGLEWGNALADVITGVLDASGRLPITMPMVDYKQSLTLF